MTINKPELEPTQAGNALVERLLAAFNGGVVRIPDEFNPRGYVDYYRPDEAMQNVLAALSQPVDATDAEGVETPFAYAYRYPHFPGGSVIRFTGGEEINGSKPIEAIPLFTRPLRTHPPKAEAVQQKSPSVEGDASSCCGVAPVPFGKNMSKCPQCGTAWGYWNSPVDAEGVSFQDRVAAWMGECFTPTICADRLERRDRLVEEALELAQTLPAFSADRAHALVDYVFSRPVGLTEQEVGGVSVTLDALCVAEGIDREHWAEVELARISDPETILKIRAKQAAKPVGSALPIALSRTPSQANDAAGQGEVDTRVLAEAAMAKARDEYHELYGAELRRLREALKDCAEPMRVLRRQAEADGAVLNSTAVAIANDASFVKGIARAALSAQPPVDATDAEGVEPDKAAAEKGLDLLDDGMCDEHGVFGCKRCLDALSRTPSPEKAEIERAIERTFNAMDNALPAKGESWNTCFKRRLTDELLAALASTDDGEEGA